VSNLKDADSIDNDSTIDDLMQQDRFAQVRTKDDENGSQEPMTDKTSKEKKSTEIERSNDDSQEPAEKSRDDYGDTPTDVNERSDERFKQLSRLSVPQLKKQRLNHS
jgi:hypothetical protein